MTELFTTVHNSSNEELKPCPFCRAPAHTWEAWGSWGVECEFCEARIRGYGSREAAIRGWNTRPGEDRARDEGFREAMARYST